MTSYDIARDHIVMTTKAEADGQASGLLLTLNRGIQMLEEIARQEGHATAKSLSSDLEINLGTCYQLLRTLQSNGYVNRIPGGRYGLGTRIGYLIHHYENQTAPPEALLDTLEHLHQSLEETVYVSLKKGTEIAIVAFREGTRALRVGNLDVGYAGYPYARASAKAFLAYTDPDELSWYVEPDKLTPLTEQTITDWQEFLTEMEATRKRGYGYDREEFAEGVACIGSVVLDGDGIPIGAYGTSVPVARMESDKEAIVAKVVSAGERASRALGYEGIYPPDGEMRRGKS